MIFEGVLNLFFGIVNTLFAPFRGLDFVFNTDIFNNAMEYLRVVFYVIPISNFLPIIGFLIATMSVRILISILKTIWQVLPFL